MTNQTNSNDEIDLGQLLQLVKNGFNNIFKAILRLFLFLKRNFLKITGLVVLGIVAGLLLNTIVNKRLKNEVIVKPNYGSENYLYDVVDELQSKFKSNDSLFFEKIGISDFSELKTFNILVEPIASGDSGEEITKDKNEYLNILHNFKENEFIIDAVRAEVSKKATLTHKIIFDHKNPENGEEIIDKLLTYINSTPYFTKISVVTLSNAELRIKSNKELIIQIDKIIGNYTEKLNQKNTKTDDGFLVLNEEEDLDITSLLSLKNGLLRDIEKKQAELVEQGSPITILSFGKTQEVKKQIGNKGVVWFPAILVGFFFLYALLNFLNRKSKEL